MSKKKKKKFQKKQLISLFENEKYQKVISKLKQFTIDGLNEDELDDILTTSYKNLAQLNFEQGDIARAIRDINSLLQRKDEVEYRLIKLKYLCYIEYFEEAISLGKELIVVKDNKRQKEAIFLYLMVKLYGGYNDLESKLLKAIPISRQRYILGFKALLEDDKSLALDYFKKCNPRAKVEKKNIKAVIAIIENQEIACHKDIKPLYKFFLIGEADGISNSKNFRAIKKEVKDNFSKIEKNIDMKNLLSLKKPVPVEVILKNAKDKEQKSRLIYNNIVLLIDRREYKNALNLFFKYKNSLVQFIESVFILMDIKNHTQDSKSDSVLIYFFSSYLKLHHKKIAPYQIDYMLLFLIQRNYYNIKESIKLAKEYNRDNFIFFLKELPSMGKLTPYYQISFNKALKKYSIFTDTLLDLMIEDIEYADKTLYNLTPKEKETFVHHLYLLIIVLENLANPHRKYKKYLFKFLKNLALVLQSFSYSNNEFIYLKLSIVIEQYIEYFKVDRFNLAIDIKALFVSISKKESVKIENENVYDEDDYSALAKKFFFEEELENDMYDFDIIEYDLSIIKHRCLNALESGEESPFQALNELTDFKYHRFRISTLLEILTDVIKLKLNHLSAIEDMLSSLKLDLHSFCNRDDLVSVVNKYALRDIETARLLLKYALDSVATTSMEYVWYLKWIDGYLTLINNYKLEKNSKYIYYRELFLSIQEKKKFKSLKSKYKKIKKLKEEGALL